MFGRPIIQFLALFAGGVILSISAHALFKGSLGPSIVVDTQMIDFGPIEVGTNATRNLKVSNIGFGVLRISDVKLACGCSQAKLSQPTLRPGESCNLAITVSSLRLEGDRSTQVLIFSNDQEHRVLNINVKYKSVSDEFISPARLDFGTLYPSELPCERHITLYCGSSKAGDNTCMPFLSIDHTNFKVAVDATNEKQALATRSIVVSCQQGIPAGEFYAVLTIKKMSQADSIQIPVFGYVRGAVYAKPRIIRLAMNSETRDQSKELLLHRRGRDENISPVLELRSVSVVGDVAGLVRTKEVEKKGAIGIQVWIEDSKCRELGRSVFNKLIRGRLEIEVSLAGNATTVVSIPVEIY